MATRSKRTRSAMAMGAGGDSASDDFLMHMDPSLMTERQQLAFLLRKTAQENDHNGSSESDMSSESDSESSDEDAPRRAPKKPRRVAPASRASAAFKASPKSPPAATREEMIAAAIKNPGSLVFYCGRGRPPKNAIKLAPGEEMPADLKRLLESAAKGGLDHLRNTTTTATTAAPVKSESGDSMKNLRVKTSAEDASETVKEQHKPKASLKTREKTSPSSTNDLSHMQVFEDHVGDVWTTQCALCCRTNSPFDMPLEALFLCPTCDRKYPTQRALGLV